MDCYTLYLDSKVREMEGSELEEELLHILISRIKSVQQLRDLEKKTL